MTNLNFRECEMQKQILPKQILVILSTLLNSMFICCSTNAMEGIDLKEKQQMIRQKVEKKIRSKEVLSRMLDYYKRKMKEYGDVILKEGISKSQRAITASTASLESSLASSSLVSLKNLGFMISVFGDEAKVKDLLDNYFIDAETLQMINDSLQQAEKILEAPDSSDKSYEQAIQLLSDNVVNPFIDFSLQVVLSESSMARGNLAEYGAIKEIFKLKEEEYKRKKGEKESYEPEDFDEYILSTGNQLGMGFISWKEGTVTATQGFKFHISATPQSALDIFMAVKPILDSYNVDYKTTDSLEELDQLNSLYFEDQAGKFITVYTDSPEQARELSIKLNTALQQFPSKSFVRVPSDHPLGSSGGLYVRYGGYTTDEIKVPTEDGKDIMVIKDDRRGPWKPNTIQDPFENLEQIEENEEIFGCPKIRITRPYPGAGVKKQQLKGHQFMFKDGDNEFYLDSFGHYEGYKLEPMKGILQAYQLRCVYDNAIFWLNKSIRLKDCMISQDHGQNWENIDPKNLSAVIDDDPEQIKFKCTKRVRK